MTERRLAVADAASLALNPSVWGGAFVVFLALRLEPRGWARWVAALLGFAAVAVAPVGLLFLLKAWGRLDDVEMRSRSQRRVVYLACAGSYVAGAAALLAVRSSWPVWGVVAVQAPAALVLAAANRRWKVSIHAAGLAGIAAAALVLFGTAGLALVPLPIAGAWARWAAGAHGRSDLVLGAVIGFSVTWGGLLVLRLLVGG